MCQYNSDLQASEQLRNFTVCIIDNGKIRNLKNQNDIHGTLVYVSNVSKIEYDQEFINCDEYVRYTHIAIVPKLS
jgi:hypothetical protein